MKGILIEAVEWAAPPGTLVLGSAGGRLCLCEWACSPRRRAVAVGGSPSAVVVRAMAMLGDYFRGRPATFGGLPLAFPDGTPFQQAVWRSLAAIPWGGRVSYGALARRLGRPEAVRAVAAAVARNPLAVILPCHRVVGADGALTGYAGTLPVKRFLLNLESREKEAASQGCSLG